MFVPYDDNLHRERFLELNVEYLTCFVDEASIRHNIEIDSMAGPTVREYVEKSLDNFTRIRSSEGIIYMLEIEGKVVGMGGLKKLEEGVGEIKRMYIRPEYRGWRYGKVMLNKLIDKGRALGYSTIRLDTADFMVTAQHIYRSAWFKEIDKYPGSEIPEWYRLYTVFMEKKLWFELIKPNFFDTINYSICQAVNDYLQEKAKDFFEEVGEYHLDEILKRGLLSIEPNDKPFDVLIKIAKYLESTGYMEKIYLNQLSEREAIIEMYGVSVSESSAKLLRENKQPSHYMTNIMFAALRRLGVQATLRDMEYNLKKAHFKEYWMIL